MTTTSFCKRMRREERIALDKWARFLLADEMIIHHNGTVTLMCKYGCICDNYMPTADELRKAART